MVSLENIPETSKEEQDRSVMTPSVSSEMRINGATGNGKASQGGPRSGLTMVSACTRTATES